MNKYIVKNCPAREDLYEWADGDLYPYPVIDTPDYCVKHKQTCDRVADCVIKQVIGIAESRNYLNDREALDDILHKFEIGEA